MDFRVGLRLFIPDGADNPEIKESQDTLSTITMISSEMHPVAFDLILSKYVPEATPLLIRDVWKLIPSSKL